jgi:hypothetical protein
MQPSYDHDHQSLHKELLGVEIGSSAKALRGRLRGRDALDKTDELDKDTVLIDHGGASAGSVHGHTPSSEASHVRSRLEAVPIYDRTSPRYVRWIRLGQFTASFSYWWYKCS